MPEMDLDLLLSRLRETLGDRGPTQISRDLGVPQSNISSYLSGKRSPKAAFLSKVADKYGVNIQWLLGFPDAPKYLDMVQEGPDPDEDIVILSRAAKKMSPEDRQKLIEMAKVVFKDAFKD